MNLKKNVSLKPFNTFCVDQSAKAFVVIQSIDDLKEGIQYDPNPVIIGGGSNILLTNDIDSLVLKNEIKGIRLLVASSDHVWIKVNGGEIWHDLVKHTVDHGWGGIENLSLIPGTVGAAPIQNIGAYGVELKDTLAEVEVLELSTGKILKFENADCKFGYRDSIFKDEQYKGKYFVLSIVLKLSKHPSLNSSYGEIEKTLVAKGIKDPTLRDMHEAIIHIRSNKLPDPKIIGNAGSFFKNPIITNEVFELVKSKHPNAPSYKVDDHHVKLPAGWLIDQCGWKGKRVGHVGCYEKQALVIVNHGGATGGEIWDFAQGVQRDVEEKFGVGIEVEINVW